MVKENKKRIVFALLALFLLAGWFYWFQLRPSLARKSCVKAATMAGEQRYSSTQERWNFFEASSVEKNNIYRACLVGQGFKPESLFVNTSEYE